jgi:putative flippase GtrA
VVAVDVHVLERTLVTCPPLLRRLPVPALALASAADGFARLPGALVGRARRLLAGDDALAQLGRFALVGGLASAVHVLLFVGLASLGDQPANLVGAVVSSSLANELHRRRTFRAGERISWFTAQWEGGGLALAGMAATSGALALLAATSSSAALAVQAALVVVVTTAVGVARFVALRWAFRPRVAPA